MAEWESSTIGELRDRGLLTLQTGPFGSQLHSADYVQRGIPVVPTEAIARRRLLTDNLPNISLETAQRLQRHRLRAGDILFARRGVQATGASALVEKSNEGWICGTGAILLRVVSGDIDSVFLSFALSSDSAIRWLKSHAVGAVMPNLNTDVISGLSLLLPPITEQRAMADLLGALDDKIELNRRMNKTLENTARAIFKSWFVDFDPVRAKAEGRQPASMSADVSSLFPNTFVDGIPNGWRVGLLGEVAMNKRGQVKPGVLANDSPYIGLEHMPRKSIALADWGRSDQVASNKFAFSTGDILFGKLRPYFHKVGVAAVDGVCSTDVLVVTSKNPEWFGFVLGHISSDELVAYADVGSTGTKMPRTNWNELARYEVVIPTPEVATAFNDIVQRMIDHVRNNTHESHTLADLRDTLLPKLLSGEVRINKHNPVIGEEQ